MVRPTPRWLAAGLLFTAAAHAADHIDAPFTDGTVAGGDAVDLVEKSYDIADVFAFPTNGGQTVALVMTVFPFADSTSRLNPDVLYQFKVDTDGDRIEDRVIQVTASGTGSAQTVATTGVTTPTVLGTEDNRLLPNLLEGVPFNSTAGVAGGTRLFVGLSDDPFYFDLAAFRNFVAEVKGEPGNDGDPDTIVGFAPAAQNDTLAGANIISIVVEVPQAELGTGTVGVWATTSLLDPQ